MMIVRRRGHVNGLVAFHPFYNVELIKVPMNGT